MAKRQSTPQAPLTRRQASRARREAQMQRWILIGTIVTAVLIVGLLVYAYINEQVIVPSKAVATVNGEIITVKQFQDRVKLDLYFAALNQFSQPPDPRVTAQGTLDSLIDEALMRQKAKELGSVEVSEEEVNRRAQLAFGYDGGTPEPTSTPVPTSLPTKDATATATATFVITPSPTTTPTLDLSVTATPTETATTLPIATATLDLTTTATPTSTFTPTLVPTITLTPMPFPTVTPLSLDAYSTQSGEFFKTGSDVTGLTSDQIQAVWHDKVRAAILSERLQVALNLTPDETREQVHAAHILVATQDEAKAVLDRIAKGELFEKLAAELSTDPSNAFRGGDLGWFSKEDMVAAFADVAFATKPGAISEPVQTQFGWHLIKVYEKAVIPLTAREKETSKQQKFVDLVKKWRDDSEVTTEDNWVQYLPTLKSPDANATP